ncbi:MAG: DUF2807 domain-containing protein [Pseudomonadota bacterium]
MQYIDVVKYSRSIGIAGFLSVSTTTAFAETKSFDFSGFDEVSIAAGIEAEILLAEEYSVVAETTEEEMERLLVSVKGETLVVSRKTPSITWGQRDRVNVSISLPMLEGVSVSSGAQVVANKIDASDFGISVSSGGFLNADGSCDALDLDVSSGGRIDATKLDCADARADASSGGSAELSASESVSAKASSGGSIVVNGKPEKIHKRVSSGGNISIR